MANYENNFSVFDPSKVDGSDIKVGIVIAEWHSDVTSNLAMGAHAILRKCNVKEENIFKLDVPGSFELTAGAQFLIQNYGLDVVICLGCIIQGETRHFEFISNAVAQGITFLEIKFGKPVIFGVLTTDTLEQALQRAGGKLGNKGEEAALAAVKMASLKYHVKKGKIGF